MVVINDLHATSGIDPTPCLSGRVRGSGEPVDINDTVLRRAIMAIRSAIEKLSDEDDIGEWIENSSTIQTSINNIVSAGGNVPIGCVVWWTGTVGNIPSGWALCDGVANAAGSGIDLTGYFIKGHDTTAGTTSSAGATSSDTTGVTVDNASGNTGSATTSITVDNASGNTGSATTGIASTDSASGSSGSSTTGISINTAAGNTGTTGTGITVDDHAEYIHEHGITGTVEVQAGSGETVTSESLTDSDTVPALSHTVNDSGHNHDLAHGHSITDTGHTHTFGSHSHDLTDGGHTHTLNSHSHGITDSGHTHTLNSHSHGITDGGHTHTTGDPAHVTLLPIERIS